MKIKTLTDQLFEASAGLVKVAPEVSDNTGRYRMADDGGVEIETGEFLYGLVKILKPENILETGTYTGISAMYMAQGLDDNGFGKLVTLEVENLHKERAEKLFKLTGLTQYATCLLQKSLDFQPEVEYDFIFLDSEPEFRFQELVKFFPYLKPGGFFFIHDLHRHLSQMPHDMFFGWPYGKLPDQIKDWVKKDQLRVISFPTPRGLSGFYKPAADDFSFK